MPKTWLFSESSYNVPFIITKALPSQALAASGSRLRNLSRGCQIWWTNKEIGRVEVEGSGAKWREAMVGKATSSSGEPRQLIPLDIYHISYDGASFPWVLSPLYRFLLSIVFLFTDHPFWFCGSWRRIRSWLEVLSSSTGVGKRNIRAELKCQIKMSGESFEERMERACRDREIPGAVLVAGDKKGRWDVISWY